MISPRPCARPTSNRTARPARLLMLASLATLAAAFSVPGHAAARKFTAANWDAAAQRLAVKAGVMSEAPSGGFNGSAPLATQAESQALKALAARQVAPAGPEAERSPGREDERSTAPRPAVQASGPITVTRFDALLVEQLGLGDVAAHVQQAATAAGLRPPSYFGTEVVARFMDLRYNHPSGEDSLELYPWNAITRAEAAHSFAVVLQSGAWAVEDARQTLEGFSLPHYSADQLKVLRIAVSKIGMPYVWAGTTDGIEDGLEHGGYDCSGFAWRVYKVSGLSWGGRILGRTAAEQGGEISKAQRVRPQAVQPADLLFFGSAHFDSRATEANIDHEGIALSGEWAIHSSGQGVYVLPLASGWLARQLAWARRVL